MGHRLAAMVSRWPAYRIPLGNEVVMSARRERLQMSVKRTVSVKGDNTMKTPADNEQPSAIDAILSERERQVRVWGNSFDDTHSQNDWVAFITSYAGRAMQKNPGDEGNPYPNPGAFVDAMIKVGALAVAALEAYERHQHKAQPVDA